MIVVRDGDYIAAIQKPELAGFTKSAPNRAPALAMMETYPNAQQMLEEINAGYRRWDWSCIVFDYPRDGRTEGYMQLYLLPDSFAHVFPDSQDPSFQVEGTALTQHFQKYGNLDYALVSVLMESLVKAAIDEESEIGFSAWGARL